MEMYIPPEELAAHAGAFAAQIRITGRIGGRREAGMADRSLGVLVRRSGDRRADSAGEGPSGAMRWLRDNLYLARQAAYEAREAFRSAGRLRAAEGRSLIREVCAELLLSGDGDTDEERIVIFLTAFQEAVILDRRELGLFRAALLSALLEKLAELYKDGEPEELRCGALWNALRRLSSLDLTEALERCDRVEQLFLSDPAGVYPRMDRASREEYRRRAALLAKRAGLTEYAAAERILELAARGAAERTRHVGFYLYDRPLGRPARRRSGAGYILANLLLSAGLSAGAGVLSGSFLAALGSLLPLSELVKRSQDRLTLRITPPRRLPRLALSDGVPPEGRTLCVISVLLTGERAADEAARRLEEYAMASRDCGGELRFGLLCDLPESREVLTAEDRRLLHHARGQVKALNERYGGGYYLFTRERNWSRADRRFIPWERKRGAVLELCRLLGGEPSALETAEGELRPLRDCRYILILDEDTRLEPECARELIGTALHPLNRPITDLRRGLVVRGHAVLQPRIAVSLAAAYATDFARLFSPQGGADPYGSSAGEVYMDRFESGGFAGKGLIHIRAYLDCMDGRIPPGLVLSHDALEGAYLRGGYVDDVELTDGFPASALSWYARQHRWIRGDWQNLPWLFAPGRELPAIERWRLLDSLRRSLLPAALLWGTGWLLFSPGPAAALAAGLSGLCLFSRSLEALLSPLGRPLGQRRVRLRSRVLAGSAEIAGDLTRLLFLPYEAWISLSAVSCALWRMLVSKKCLLQWRTAQQAEASAGNTGAYFRSMWSSVVFGAVLLAASPLAAGLALGVVWMAAPLAAAGLSRKKERSASLPQRDRDFLLRRAGEMWRYFRDNCRPEDHYLPPDNIQDVPPAEPARRVSPTNLGFALLSAVCAARLGLAKEQEAMGLCRELLVAAGRMEKWRGHLYNWYDTRTLRPLEPAYVSTVDSGNLWACLLAVSGALRRMGGAKLAEAADELRLGMDFLPLYDEKRQLFRIGLIPGQAPGRSWYDLMESEARLTGYIAVASGQVSKKHWRRLGRAQAGHEGFRGMVSWSGSLFEYLMPELFLPLFPNSHLWESARFALYVQRRHTAGPDGLWGVSESAFYALDAADHYRYKAHGVPALALCRDMGADLVISPYSSYLALAAVPRAAVKNLRRMERQEYMGPYGLWEAVDFTSGRCASERGAPVRCVMVHHLGMSLAAVTNVLADGAVRKWFMEDPAMAAYTGLLQEKVPLEPGLVHRSARERRPRTRSGAELRPPRTGQGTDWLHPQAALLSNGAYSLLFTESGVSRARCGSLAPYRSPLSGADRGRGMELYLRQGKEYISLLPQPGDGGQWSWEFGPDKAVLTGAGRGMSWSVTAELAPDAPGERRRVTLRREAGAEEAALYLAFEPVLLPEKDYRAHPSFGRLGIFTQLRDGVLSVRRLPRGRQQEQYLALAVSCPAEFSCDSALFPGRGGANGFVPNTGWQSRCLAAARAVLPAGETESTVTFALCAGGSEDAAVRGAAAIAEGGTGLRSEPESEYDEACALLPALVWPGPSPAGSALAAPSREELWRLGISGDVPILAMECAGEQALSAAKALLRQWALLRRRGMALDLVFLTADKGEYRRACQTALEKEAGGLGADALPAREGRVHFASLDTDRDTVCAASALWYGRDGLSLPRRRTDIAPRLPVRRSIGDGTDWRFEPDGTLLFTAGTSLPARSWGNILTGGALSWFAAECGTGALWYRNARECPVIPWRGDPLSADGPERLTAETEAGPVSLFAAADGFPCAVCFGPGWAAWEKTVGDLTVKLTAFIPPDRSVRVFLLESSRAVTVRWSAPLQLAPEAEDAPCCAVVREEGLLRGMNPRCPWPDTAVYARCSAPWQSAGCDEGMFLAGENTAFRRSGSPALCGSFLLDGEAVLLLGTEDAPELLSPAPAREALDRCRKHWTARVCRLRGDRAGSPILPLLNGWAAYQALACRVLGRSSMYQSGGAVGFRDQLQDRVNLLWLDSEGCREHILACCAHQYKEGDVQHWWHPGAEATDRGVRSRCSDDLLWLPWAVCAYADATGDLSLCAGTAVFIDSPPLEEGEVSRYELPRLSGETGTVLDHCHRALWLTLQRGLGAHRLLLMGSGDWNDGFDAMGPGAESVWLTWFASIVFHRFSLLLAELGESGAERYEEAARALGTAADRAWEGDHYLRGWYGDGTPLGGRGKGGCAVDSVAQSFAAFCPYADGEKVDKALDTALERLWDRERHIIKLYDPPFAPGDRSPGYVASYGPGFRENGGQYTHAAVWLARACFRRGRWDEGAALLEDIALAARAEGYGAEPNVIAADVYTAPGQEGRAGWSWYTGSAGWWYRTAWEDMLGFAMRRGETSFTLPDRAAELGWTVRDTAAGEAATSFPQKMENNS